MNYTVIFAILMLSTKVFAHGFIEKISCESFNTDQHLYFYGHETTITEGDTPFKLHFMLFSEGTGVIDLGAQEFELEDIVDGQNVVEKITINFGGQNFAELFIPEVYSEKSRSGEGYIQLESSSVLKADLSCQVIYE